MTTRYITERTTYLYKDSTSGKRTSPGLIYGDEVEADKKSNNGRLKVKFRDFEGYVAEDHLGDSPVMEMYFIDVGQGDSTFIVTPSRKKILIDGGANKRAYGFLSWKYRLDKDGDPIDIDLLILLHADGDHIDGLVPIIKHPKIMVHRIVHNGIATFEKDVLATELGDLDKSKTYLVTRHSGVDELDDSKISKPFKAWKDSIIEKGVACEAVDSTTGTLDIGDPDVRIEVLGPRLDSLNGKNCYKWFDEKPITINGHSVVLRMNWKYISVLLPDDINTKGAAHLLGDPGIIAKMNAHVFKAPHHGSKDFSRSFLEAVRPQIPIISSGDEPDYGHPRAECIGALGQLSRSTKPLVFSTEIAATFAEDKKDIQKETEKNKEDEATVEKSDLGKPNSSAVARRIFKRILNGMINSAPTVVRYTLPGG